MNALLPIATAMIVGAVAAMPDAQAIPDLPTLRAKIAAASGAAPDNYRETIQFNGTAASGQRVEFHRGEDYREILDEDALHSEFGRNHGDRWHQNPNGHVVIDQDDPGLAIADPTTTSVSRVNRPIDAFVIATLNGRGFGTREFVDPVTSYVVRRERSAPNGTITTTYEDFTSFGTRHLPARWTVHDETTGTETHYFNRSYVAGAATEADVAIPTNRRTLVEFPAGINRVVLPATFEPSGHVMVRLTVGGRGLDFILDTGSGNITLDPGVAASLGLTVTNKMQSSVNAGRYATGTSSVPELHAGPLTLHDTIVSIVPLGFEEPQARPVGLLGFDFLCELGVTIDYEHRVVTAERFGTYTAPADARAIDLELRLGNQIPLITATIDGTVAERILVDTGGAGPFMLMDYFSRRHPDILKRNPDGPPMRLVGAGGAFESNLITLDDVRLGNVNFTHFAGYRVTSAGSYAAPLDGLIGPTFLRFFDVHLDYPDGHIYLVPNATGRGAMR